MNYEKKENVFTGTLGALIGALLGAVVILLLSRIGLVASISGLVLAFCTFKGYALLGKQLSVKGFVICLILIIITPYFADRLDWALRIRNNFSYSGLSIGEAFANIPDFIEIGIIKKSNYIMNLVLLYVFAALGAFGTIRDILKR